MLGIQELINKKNAGASALLSDKYVNKGKQLITATNISCLISSLKTAPTLSSLINILQNVMSFALLEVFFQVGVWKKE